MGYTSDCFKFTDVFGERNWIHDVTPAAYSISMLQLFEPQQWKASLTKRGTASAAKSKKLNDVPDKVAAEGLDRPTLFQVLNVEMQMPLSSEGYENLLDSLHR
jgi:hypothetical protein